MAESAPRDQVLEVQPSPILKDSRYRILSGFHLGNSDFSENENNWENVSFARYYHIRGIRRVNP